MNANVGTIDRTLRIIGGNRLYCARRTRQGRLVGLHRHRAARNWTLALCPAYTLLGLRTCPLAGAKTRNT